MEQQMEVAKVKEEYCPEDETCLTINQLQKYYPFAAKQEELNIKSELVDEKPFICTECPESFAYSELLDIHKTIHSAPIKQKKKCPCCHRTYLLVLRYKLHIQNHLTSYRRCTFCPNIFFDGHLFHRHIADHKRNGELTCPYCQKCFTAQRSLTEHIRIHTNERPYTCGQCDKSFTGRSSLYTHIKVHRVGKPTECPTCLESFPTKSSLRSHTKKVHLTEKLQNCSSCEQTFENKDLLGHHMKQHHSAFYKKCQICKEEFTKYAEYFNHHRYCNSNQKPLLERKKENINGKVLKEEDNYSEDIKHTILNEFHVDSNPFKKDSMKLQPKIQVDKTFFTCRDCPEIFEYREFLELHRTIHEPLGKKRRKCPLCRSTFQKISEYAEHIQTHLTSSYRCRFCPKIFLSYVPFRKHIVDHKKNRDLVCPYCGKSFSIKRSLDIHIRIHTNERPYKCDDCGKTFIQLSTLGTHKKLVHKLGELLSCPECSNQFSTRSSLTRHIKRIHNSGKFPACTECKKEFTTKELLEKHRIEHHSSLSAFYEVCLVCKKEFFTHAQYIDHHHDDGDYPKERHSRLSEDDKPMTDILEFNTQQAKSSRTKKVTCWLCGEKVVISDHPNHKRDHMMLTEEELIIHRMKGIYPCKKCDKLYATRKRLFEHMDCHMTKQYKCSNTCDEKSQFTYAGLKQHLQKCQLSSEANKKGKNNLGCKWCPVSFKSIHSMLMHYRKHMDSTGYQCNECSKRFSRPVAVKAHIRLAHGKIFSLQYCYEQLAFKQQKTCRWCKVGFVRKKALECHENLHKSNEHQCKECKISFPRFAIYLSHIRNMKCQKWTIEALIPEVKQLKCIFCAKIFGDCILITRHLLAIHMKELYPCKFCGSSVALQSLRTHLIKNHNSENKYSCLGCDASFITLKAYVEHRNIYPQRPFSHKDAVQPASVPMDSDITVKVEENHIVDTIDRELTNHVLVKAEEDDIVDIPDTVWVNDKGELKIDPSELACC